MNLHLNDCGGIGNVCFRIASLYGIGKELNRKPCLQAECVEGYHIELYSMFPNLKRFSLKNCPSAQTSKQVKLPDNVWNYHNISRLHKYDKYTSIDLYGSYLQSHKYFHWIRNEVLQMFDFSDALKGIVDDYARHMFNENDSIKVCAHIRQGDFKGEHPLLFSTNAFTINGLHYLLSKAALNERNRNLSVLLFSDDVEFSSEIIKQITTLKLAQKAFVVQQLNRIENIALAARHCDYFLITSSGSTFGWWMAYLMPDEKQANIYYNSLFFKKNNKKLAKDWREQDFFPSKWNRLVYDDERNVIFEQNRSIPVISV